MKKLLSMILAITMLISSSVWVFAADGCNHCDDNEDNRCDDCSEYVGSEALIPGENDVTIPSDANEGIFISFVPTETATYCIYSTSESDPWIDVYDSTWNDLDGNDDDNYGRNDNSSDFYLVMEFVANETYYFHLNLHSSTSGNSYKVTIEKHESCSDGTDKSIGLCDACWEYMGTKSLALGENTVSGVLESDLYTTFVPDATGTYKIYSDSKQDPCLTVFNSDMHWISTADDQDGTNFICIIDLEGGETYYFAFYEYEESCEYTVTIEKHTHSGTEQTCNGYFCKECENYFGEVGDHKLSDAPTCQGFECEWCGGFFGEPSDDALDHVWYYGTCFYCDGVTYPADTDCTHEWNTTRCQCYTCGEYCYHTGENKGTNCETCGTRFGLKVITNGEVTYADSVEKAIEIAVDGSTVMLMYSQLIVNIITIDKEITLDFNGCNINQPSSYNILIYSRATLMDSVGGGYNGGIWLYSPAVILGGTYDHIKICFDTEDTLEDYVGDCVEVYDVCSDERVDIAGLTYVSTVELWVAHNETQTCIGSVCLDCGEALGGEAKEDAHSFESYEHSKIATCVHDAQETAVCEWCKTATDTRDIENTATGKHEWHGNYGEGTKTCYDCGSTVKSSVYSDEAVRGLVRDAYEYLKELIWNMLVDKFGK